MLRIIETLVVSTAIVMLIDALIALFVNGKAAPLNGRPVTLAASLSVLAAVFVGWTLLDLATSNVRVYHLTVILTMALSAGMFLVSICLLRPTSRQAWWNRLATIGTVGFESERKGALLVLLLAATLGVMYQNAAQSAGKIDALVDYYIAIFKGRPDAAFEELSRLVVPTLMFLGKKTLGNHDWTLIVVAFVITGFSLMMLYLLSLRLTGSAMRAGLAAAAMAVFVPIYIGQLYPLSAPLLFGLYCGMCWAVLAQRPVAFVVIGTLGILQRPELVVCAALFQIFHERLHVNWRRAVLPVGMIVAAIALPLALKALMGITETVYFEKIARWSCGVVNCPAEGEFNVLYLKKDVFLYLPIIAGLLWTRRWDRRCAYMLLALAPYTGLFLLVGDLTEPRLFFPLAAVALANIAVTAEACGESGSSQSRNGLS